MQTIKVVYEREHILLDENNQAIDLNSLPHIVKDNFYQIFSFGSPDDFSYYQEIYDSYFSDNYPYSQEESINSFNQWILITACELKTLLPETKILFKNTNQYYQLPVDENFFSEIPLNFDISTIVLLTGQKKLRVMFDYEATGVWDSQGCSIPVEWVPCSQSTRNLISQFQLGLNRMRIPYDDDFTPEEELESDNYMKIGLQAAISLKKDLPDWTILFYNYGSYFDLPLDDDNNSEITSDLSFENFYQ